jgi:hypothetical protein
MQEEVDAMTKKDYLIIGLGVYIILEAIIGIRQNVSSGLPYFFLLLNWAIALTYLCTGIFLIQLKNWARIVAIVTAIIYFVLAAFALYVRHQEHSLLDTSYILKAIDVKTIAHFLINGFIIYYLTRSKVRELFR